jgi:2-keto-3-deoxy-6-phosphogluconate aldolase
VHNRSRDAGDGGTSDESVDVCMNVDGVMCVGVGGWVWREGDLDRQTGWIVEASNKLESKPG